MMNLLAVYGIFSKPLRYFHSDKTEIPSVTRFISIDALYYETFKAFIVFIVHEIVEKNVRYCKTNSFAKSRPKSKTECRVHKSRCDKIKCFFLFVFLLYSNWIKWKYSTLYSVSRIMFIRYNWTKLLKCYRN